MARTSRAARRWRIGACFLLGLLGQPAARGQDAPQPPDCGVNALYLLLQLEGCPVPLERLDRALPPRSPDGYSMAELARASRAMGLPLRGLRFAKGDAPLKRSAIAYFQDARAGHFVVLRPVGTTGTMVQVIDPPDPPQIVDYERLFRQSPWTGRILTPGSSWMPARIAGALALIGLVALAVGAARRPVAPPGPTQIAEPDVPPA